MRLFQRRKVMEFDDPRLVGMAPLKLTEENIGVQLQPTLVMPTLKEERPLGEGLQTLKRVQQPDKCKMTNVSTWRRVARPWDSLRRAESSETLSRPAISNRRKTLHFYPDTEESKEKCEERGQLVPRIEISERIILQQQQQQHGTITAPPKRKIGRVESLRLLLSKSNRIYRGKFVNSKHDKETSTSDLNHDTENFSMYAIEDEEVFHSKCSSISSHKSDTIFSPLSATSQFRSRYQFTKATSCENLSLQNINQARTLPGYRDVSTSTSTTPFLDSSCFSPQTSATTANAKRSSFPYAYIRSRLSSLQEEPKKSPIKPPRVSISKTQDQKQQPCSLASNFMHKGFYHSMGNLLTGTKEGHSSAVDADGGDEVDVESVCRNFDPLKQIRIDLLHMKSSEIDEQSTSPTFWGRRSYSIGDMLEKRTVGKSDSGNSNGVEESGYDSDSTRNGHESPRNSVKSPSSETEADTIEREQCEIKESTTINGKSETDESLDSQSQSNESEISSGSSCSFPASGGCLITINRNPSSRAPSVNGFRKGEDGLIEEVTSEIDQSENVDFYSTTTDGVLEDGVNEVGMATSIKPTEPTATMLNYQKSSSNVFVSNGAELSNRGGGGEMSVTLVEPNKEVSTTSIKKEPMNDSSQKSAPSLRLRNRVRDKDREWNCIKSSRSKSLCLSIFTVNFNKGPKKKSLGFSIIGGKDSPVPGIFIKRVFPYGQASEDGSITEGDEILSVNGQPLANSTHAEALNIFKSIKTGDIILEVARREFLSANTSQTLKRQYSQLSSKSCEQLHQVY